MDSGYQQEPVDAGRVRFTITPARLPRFGVAPVAFATVGLAALASFGAWRRAHPLLFATGVIAFAIVAVRAIVVDVRSIRMARRRNAGGTFIVSPHDIEAHGRTIRREQLAGLAIRNASHGSAVCWMLCAEAGSAATILAGGMTEQTALGLLTDVRRILNRG